MFASLINGEESASLPVDDRSILYGDALFETIAINAGVPLLLEQHISRLSLGVERLGFNLDFSLLAEEINYLIETRLNNEGSIHVDQPCILRITVTRGVSGRGYCPDKGVLATRVLTLHDWPASIDQLREKGAKLAISDVRLSEQPLLSGIKHANRLEQVLAAQSIPKDYDDVVLLNTNGDVVCSSKGNLFALVNGVWITNELEKSGIAGIMRDTIGNALYSQQITDLPDDATKVGHASLTVNELYQAESVFMCNSIVGVVPVRQINNIPFNNLKYPQMIYQYLQSIGACL